MMTLVCVWFRRILFYYLLLLLLSLFSRVRLCAHRGQPTRLSCPWDSPGKNTGVGCHFLLQCMKVKSESEVAQSCNGDRFIVPQVSDQKNHLSFVRR